jgi:hypothetical protein
MNALPHPVQWVTAAPLWPTAQHDRDVMQRPVILRFTTDQFMEELIAELAASPEALGARSVTGSKPSYRERAPGEDSPATTEHLKLYQPAHGHFYLVASSLVCRLPGLPDHAIDRAHDERAGFVIRRVDGSRELALIGKGAARTWRAVARLDALASGEDLLPMFPLGLGEPGRRRRLFAGVVPVARQDELQAAPIERPGAAAPAKSTDDLLEDIDARVVHAIELLQNIDPPASPETDAEVKTSRFILLDLADFLHRELNAVFLALAPGAARPAGAQGALVDLLVAGRVQNTTGPTFAAALGTAWQEAATIVAGHDGSLTSNLRHAAPALPGELRAALAGALREVIGPEPAPPASTPVASTFYLLRCVYRRQHCGPLKPDVLSTASERFTLAAFFDPDAPARPIRISLPIDPSIAGLRKFRKNVTVALSTAMKQKLTSASALKDSKLVASPEFDCAGLSFSIPTITICATILLFIMLGLLNLIFWWLPFVKICLPKLKLE